MTEFAALRPKTYFYLMDAGNNHKKAKGAKQYVIKKYLNLKMKLIIYILQKLIRWH